MQKKYLYEFLLISLNLLQTKKFKNLDKNSHLNPRKQNEKNIN